MTKLKTLKDIEVLRIHNPLGLSVRAKEELCQVAREWIKELRRYDSSDDKGYHKHPEYPPSDELAGFVSFKYYEHGGDEQETENLIAWIKYFFNLEDDDND